MPNANSVSSSSSNNQNMEINQGSFRQVTGGDRIYARELYNGINIFHVQHTETNDEIDDRINRLVNNSINRMRERVVRMDNTLPICVISNPPYPNNSESSRRE